MMNETELNAELAHLADVLAVAADAEPWSAAWANRQSLLMRQNELFDAVARLGEEYELEVQIAGPVVVPNSVPANFMGRFLAELQLTVSSAVQAIVSAATDRGPFGQGVIGASAMSVVGARPGSFILGLAGPPNRSVQLEIVDPSDQPLPAFEEAMERIFVVLDLVESDVAAGELPEAVSNLGHRAVRHLNELAGSLSSADLAARIVQHSPFLEKQRESGLSPTGARRLETLLSRTEQTTDHFTEVGTLTGVRWRSRRFDLEVAEGVHEGTYTGSIPDELRDAVRQHFDRPALITIERTTTKTAVEGEDSLSYRVVDVTAAP